MGLTRLNSTAYFCRLIQGNEFKGRSPKLNHALYASVNMIYSNVKQITRHQRARGMDAEAVSKLLFLTDKLCEEVYLLSNAFQSEIALRSPIGGPVWPSSACAGVLPCPT